MKVIIRQAVLFFIVILACFYAENERSEYHLEQHSNPPPIMQDTISTHTEPVLIPPSLGGAASNNIVSYPTTFNPTGGATVYSKSCPQIYYNHDGLVVCYIPLMQQLTNIEL